ncbi:MAG: hypothetical protein PHR35_22905, partial [Kiritimatiellae bacterium]|nr:hypothetical protein [Kiritimatiellia bacterium]
QTIRFDNMLLEDVGLEQPARQVRRVFARLINWPYAELDLDCLIPGCAYELAADVIPAPSNVVIRGLSPNARPSAERAPDDERGMGITMFVSDFRGRVGPREDLVEMPDRDGRKIYRFKVPADAVIVHLDLHNDDMVRFDHNQIEGQARRWGSVSLDLLNYGEIAADNQMVQYNYRGRPNNLEPRAAVEVSEFDRLALDAKLRRRKPANSRLERGGDGKTRWIIDGKVVPPMLATSFAVGEKQPNVYEELGRNGINIVEVRFPAGGAPNNGNWIGPDKYDFKELDRQFYMALKQNPNAYLIFDFDEVTPPYWWGEAHPDELMRDQFGRFCWMDGVSLYKRHYGTMAELKQRRERLEKQGFFEQLKGASWPGTYVPSPGSMQFRAEVARFLAAMRRHIESMPYGNAVIGYKLLWGFDGQWGWIGGGVDTQTLDKGQQPAFVDCSQPMLARFREYVRKKYRTEERLRAAWNDPKASFASVGLPSFDRLHFQTPVPPGSRYLLDPSEDQPLIDFRECTARGVGEQCDQWARAVKAAGRRDVVCLAYYPDISEMAPGRDQRHVLNSPGLDIAGGPSYEGREIGLDCLSNVLLDSLNLHGKLPMTEIDFRVFSVVKRNYSNNIILDSPRKTISALRREYMKQICRGGGSWTLDMAGGWFADPLVAAVIGDARRVFGGVLGRDRRSVARAALFLGEQGSLVQADELHGVVPKTMVSGSKVMLQQSGVPVDEYHLWDLPAVADKYRVFLFPFAYALTDEERGWIESLKRDGNLLVFGYGAGYAGHHLSLANMESVLGMKLGRDDKLNLTIRVVNREHPVTREMRGFLGTMSEPGLPGVYVDDPQAVALATFAGATNRVGMAFKDHGSWQSLYVGVPAALPPELMRGCARYKRLHIYNSGNDVMYFNKSLVAIHANSDGVKTIELPEEAEVTSLWDDTQ